MATTTETYMCTSCGSALSDPGLAQHQLANVKGGQTPMCADCIDTHVRNGLEPAFEAIREALNASNRREWDAFAFEEKFIRFLHYRNEGIIRPEGAHDFPWSDGPVIGANLSLHEVVRLKAAQMRYDGTLDEMDDATT